MFLLKFTDEISEYISDLFNKKLREKDPYQNEIRISQNLEDLSMLQQMLKAANTSLSGSDK